MCRLRESLRVEQLVRLDLSKYVLGRREFSAMERTESVNAPPGRLIALGSINVDVQVRVDGEPPVGETSFGHDFAILPGGKAANVAYVARRLGIEAELIGAVGSDDMADRATAPLEAQ